MKKAFTLMEVNLAILIMAGGLLAIISLYSLGFRENRQSREDVAAAAYADAVISPLVMAITATNLKWSAFSAIGSYPSETWESYYDSNGVVVQNPDGKAKNAFDSFMGQIRRATKGSFELGKAAYPTAAAAGLRGGLLIVHDPSDARRFNIAFRASKNSGELLGAPIFYTEAVFQGLSNE